MLKIDMINIPNDEFDEFEDEPNDELASSGFRVVDATAEKAEDEDEDEEELEEELEDEEDLDEEEETEAEKPDVLDGLKELEEMEKSYVDPPITFEEEE